jgi:hypothetical protein
VVRRIVQELVILSVGMVVFTGIFAVLDLVVHGSVRW